MPPDEYYTIANLEDTHWWYRSLHNLVLSAIMKNFNNKNITIVDAGCGAGGLMMFLKSKGYENVKGFDISEVALKLCAERGLDVFKGDLKEIANYYPIHSADVIISNDTFYFLNESEQRKATDSIFNLLKGNGLFILNIPSLHAFRGIHDLHVGINRRFNGKNVWKLLDRNKFDLVKKLYWPLVLSPFIWAVRFGQRMKLRLNTSVSVTSDVKMRSKVMNSMFLRLTNFENTYISRKPFGSSLFLAARVKK